MIPPGSLRHALRSLSKSPGFFLVATACLGLSLALNTTTLAILDAMVHPSLPVKDPERLFYVSFWPRQLGNDAPMWKRYQVLRAATFYEGIAFFDWTGGGTLRVGADVRDVPVSRVTSISTRCSAPGPSWGGCRAPVFAAFAAFALLLAAVGLYGVVSYAVTQRMREFAVRVAVGAPRPSLVRLVAHDAVAMTLAGIGLGAFLAMWASTLLGSWLADVYHTDALSLVVAEGVLAVAALVACLHPVLRATRANPIEILRAI